MTAVLFDLDGTLIDSLPNIRDAANAVLARCDLPPLALETVGGFVGLGEQVFVDRLIGATDLDPGARGWIMEAFIGHYREEAGKTRAFSGAIEALKGVRLTGRPLGLVTNKPRAPLGPTLQSSGLEGLFDVIVAGDDLPKRKPDPLPLHHAMAQLGVTDCVYVGDSETDAATAENAGVPFVLYTEGIRHTPVSDLRHTAVFSDFTDLADVLAGIVTPT